MSIQLIVYPQSFNGLNAISGVGTEQVVDGINFNTFNTSAVTINVPTPTYQNAINTINPTMVVNTWYRFSAGSAAAAPYLSPGGVQVPNTTGFLQKLSNLIAGETYEVTIETICSKFKFRYNNAIFKRSYKYYYININKTSSTKT